MSEHDSDSGAGRKGFVRDVMRRITPAGGRLEDEHDPRMVQPRHRSHFVAKCGESAWVLGARTRHDFEGDLDVLRGVAGSPDIAHSAASHDFVQLKWSQSDGAGGHVIFGSTALLRLAFVVDTRAKEPLKPQAESWSSKS